MDARCRVELFGGLRLVRDSHIVTRFRTHSTASLLAVLALELPRAHARDELVELLWPDVESERGRANLRTCLTYLRRLLEPPGVPYNHVLVADRSTVRLEPAAVSTDAGEFSAAREAARIANDPAEEISLLSSCVRCYTGELLTGFFDEWALVAREQFADSYAHALRRLVRLLAETRDYAGAIEMAQRLLKIDALDEQAILALMRLYAATGAADRAVQLFDLHCCRIREGIGANPSATLKELAEKLRPVAARRRSVAGPAPETIDDSPPLSAAAQPTIPSRVDAFPRIPLIPTAFFGRGEEMASLERLLSCRDARSRMARLVTLTGPGGVGKTRFAVEVGRRLIDTFGGRVWFVPFADVSEPDRIPQTIASVLRLPPIQNETAFDQIVGFLRDRSSLLILDNLEHIVEGCGEVVSALLQNVPELTCLVTSRRSLEVEGEQELPVEPLVIPASVGSPEEAMAIPAIQLFADRAQKVRPEFQITTNNVADVAAVALRLEGIPLALELAAARSRVLTPHQMRAYLADGLEVLANRRAGKDARHRSLWAAIEWSYRLLSPAQRRAFARLSVFEGGWTLAAAEAVLNNCHAPDMLDQLRIDSLIIAEEVEGEMRYRMLETIREFASARLQPDERKDTEARHAAHYAALTHDAMEELRGPRQAHWLSLLDRDLDNIRAALRYCAAVDSSVEENGLKLVSGMWRYWIQRGLVGDGLALSRAIVTRPNAKSAAETYVDALNSTGGLALSADNYELCTSLHQEAARAARECGYRYGLGAALDDWGCVEIRRGDYAKARDLLEESVAIHREAGHENGIANALTHLALALQKAEEFGQAETVCEEAIDRLRRLNDQLQLATTLSNLGMIVDRRGDSKRARLLYTESLQIHRVLGNRSGAALTLGNLGVLERTEGDFDTARQRFVECLATFRELGMRRAAGLALTELGKTEENLGNLETAKDLHIESLSLQRELGAKDGIVSALVNLGRLQAQLGARSDAVRCLTEALELCTESGQSLTAAGIRDELAAIAT